MFVRIYTYILLHVFSKAAVAVCTHTVSCKLDVFTCFIFSHVMRCSRPFWATGLHHYILADGNNTLAVDYRLPGQRVRT